MTKLQNLHKNVNLKQLKQFWKTRTKLEYLCYEISRHNIKLEYSR